MTMARSNDEITRQGERDVLQSVKNMAFVSGLFAEGSSDHLIKTVTNTIVYMIDGVLYTKAPTDDIPAVVCAIQPAGRRCRYLISLNIAGTVTVTKGTEVVSLTTGAITTLSWDAANKMLFDSGNGLGSFKAKDLIVVSGFTSNENNGTFIVEAVPSDGSYVRVRENGMVDEAAGDSVTALRGSPLPECPVKQCAVGIMTVVTGTAAFTVGVDDITGDIGSGSVAFQNIGIMPSEGITA